MFYFVSVLFLFCFVLFCFVLFCFVLFCFVLFCFCFVFVLFCFVLFVVFSYHMPSLSQTGEHFKILVLSSITCTDTH